MAAIDRVRKCPLCGASTVGYWEGHKSVIHCTNPRCKAQYWDRWYTWEEWGKYINRDFKTGVYLEVSETEGAENE